MSRWTVANKQALLVVGSRAFDPADPDPRVDRPARLVRESIRSAVTCLASGSGVVLSGGARGPDTWAREAALAAAVPCVEYRLDGYRWLDGVRTHRWPDSERLARELGPKFPLARNAALARAMVAARDGGFAPAWEAYVANWSRTAGTGHMVGQLRLRGIDEACGRVAPYDLDAARLAAPAPPAPDRAGSSDRDLVFVDTETTGLQSHDVVIQVAYVHTDRRAERVFDSWVAKLALPPGVRCHPEAAKVNGYSPTRWADARPAREVLAEFLDRLPPRFVLAGHNTPFDKRMLVAEFRRYDLPLPGWHPDAVDTKFMAKQTLLKTGRVPDVRLATLCDYLAISNTGEHEALADCERTLEVYRLLSRTWEPEEQAAGV